MLFKIFEGYKAEVEDRINCFMKKNTIKLIKPMGKDTMRYAFMVLYEEKQ